MDILFDNIINARDLGGMIGAGGRRVRQHRLIRSAHLHDASPADLRRLHEEYNLAKIFDFRSFGEADALPDQAVEGAEHHLLPTIDLSAERLTEQPIPQEAFLDLEAHIVNYSFYPEVQKMAANMYPSLIESEFSQLQYASFLRLIVEAPEDGGILWHCFQGKDRTGWGAAFLLFALGVEREAIIEDFDLSNTAYRSLVAQLNAQIDERGGGEPEKEVILAFMGVSTPNFLRTLDLIDRKFGGMMNYLHEQLFLAPDDIHLLRQRFLQ
ncbi:MAG: tyrosine-protein phosphatase [Paludibacteraceae bacterium]|nr:tyrosine-protein phosphatase [Paludibacteraceae bacterium]